MESNLRSEVSLPSYESVIGDIAMLKRKLRSQLITFIRNVVGSIQGQYNIQAYIKFKSALMELYFSLRPKKSSWPITFLDTFMLDSVDWPSHLRLQKILKVEDLFKKLESDLSNNEFYTESCNNKSECVKNNSECSESIDDDNVSCEYEEMDSKSSESDDFSQQDEDGYITKNK
jgi:hypothetical protein